MLISVNIPNAAEALLAGEVVVLPTDTVYGLAAHPAHPAAIAALFALKHRPPTVPLQLLVPESNDLGQWLTDELGAIVTAEAQALIRPGFMPGPLSLILKLAASERPTWLATREELGVRCPSGREIQAILKQTGPLFATSANRHRHPTPREFEAVFSALAPARPLKGLDGGTLSDLPSTIVNLTSLEPNIIRQGVITAAHVAAALQNPRALTRPVARQEQDQ